MELLGVNTNSVSDGAHTFGELYFHRMVMFNVIINMHKSESWKSKKHEDGTMYDGYFIVGIDTPDGQFSYHYEMQYWNIFDCKILKNSPYWDGHTPDDVTRLFSL